MAVVKSAFAASVAPASSTAVSSFAGRHATCGVVARRSAVLAQRRVAGLRMHHAEATATSTISTETQGAAETQEFRLFYKADGATLSPWHDIAVFPDPSNKQIVNFVNEIPKGTQAKMEIATDEEKTPIKQDIKKGALRFYKWGPSLINYGAVPQTWEDPGSVHPEVNVAGDNDPADLCEVSDTVAPFGSVYPVKLLGALAMIDEDELDWKLIGISSADPLAEKMNDIDDLETLMPGKVDSIREWFRMYKTAEGKGENSYAYNGECKNAAFAIKVVEETHESYIQLKSGKIPNEDGLWLK